MSDKKSLVLKTYLLFIIFFVGLTAGCSHAPKPIPTNTEAPTANVDLVVVQPESAESVNNDLTSTQTDGAADAQIPATTNHNSAWSRLASSNIIDTYSGNPKVQGQLEYLLSKPDMIERFANRSKPYFVHVLNTLESRELPLELAVLPFIESAYNPAATSRKGAAGLWQLMLGTARELKVKQTIWYDGRRDLIESTDSALTYLNFLSEKFDQDWLLALAAYNGGHNRVSRLIKANQKKNLGTSFWDLPLPRETKTYVPRYLAMLELLRSPEQYALQLPELSNDAFYEKVPINKPVDITLLEKKLGLAKGDLTSLNNGFIREVTPPGKSWSLLIPDTVSDLAPAMMAKMPSPDLSNHTLTHRIQRGETLSHISKRYGVRVSHIQRINNLANSRIRAGRKLTIPAPVLGKQSFSQPNPDEHVVQRGETLWDIARKYHLSLADLTNLNRINEQDLIRPGEILLID